MKKKLLSLLVLPLMMGLVASCGSDKPAEPIDYVSKAKLTQDYKGHDFISEGIGELSLKMLIDGDTTHFESKSRLTAKVRYLGVDTPESTGKVEPWGKTAAKHTADLINNATVIVGQDKDMYGGTSEYKVCATDGNLRQLGLIWVASVANPTLDDFVCINLSLVQNGFSGAKGVAGFEYEEYFRLADEQATAQKIHIWSDDKDPDFYYGDAYKISIKEAFANPTEYVGKKINVYGVISRVTGSYDAYLQQDIVSEETGEIVEQYGLFLFAGYRSIAPIRTQGNELNITGVFGEFGGSYQLSGLVYSEFYPGDDDPKIISTGNTVTPLETNVDKVAAGEYLNLLVELKNVKVTGGYGGLDEIDRNTGKPYTNNAMTLWIANEAGESVKGASIRIPQDVTVYNDGEPIRSFSFFKDKFINITGIMTKYTSTSGNTTYAVSLCSRSEIEVL